MFANKGYPLNLSKQMETDYSIIIPAFNEEELLPNTLRRVKVAMKASALKGEIVVCDNNSGDNTAAIAKKEGARVVFEPYNQISKARNTAAKNSTGKYFIFLDADTYLSGEVLQKALANMINGQCCGGGALLKLDQTLKPIQKAGLAFFNRLSRTFSLAAGCFIYCTKESYLEAGGFSEQVYAAEEILFSIRMQRRGKKRGKRFCIIDSPRIVTSGRKLDWFGPLSQGLLIVMVSLFPFLIRYRAFCWFWYKRPTMAIQPGPKTKNR